MCYMLETSVLTIVNVWFSKYEDQPMLCIYPSASLASVRNVEGLVPDVRRFEAF